MADIIKWNKKKSFLFRFRSSFCCSHEANQKQGLPLFNTPPEIVKRIAIYRLNVIKPLLFLSRKWMRIGLNWKRSGEGREQKQKEHMEREEGKQRLTCSSECKSFRSMSAAFSFSVLTATVVTPSLPAKTIQKKKKTWKERTKNKTHYITHELNWKVYLCPQVEY